MGYPTANIEITDKNKLVPGNGVYAVQLTIGKRQLSISNKQIVHHTSDIIHGTSHILHHTFDIEHLKGMMNIGVRPTVGGTKKVIEVNIFDFDESVYDQHIRVYVQHFLRDEIKFNDLEALKEQLTTDKTNALKLLKKN